MSLQSDLTLNVSRFVQTSVPDDAKRLNALLAAEGAKGPAWHEVGAAEYRVMWEEGRAALPPPTYLSGAQDASLPSREAGREILIRVYRPDNGVTPKGIFLHFHGGGWVLGSHRFQDESLARYANNCQMTAISVGYRLAPEDPYPAGFHDCFDAAEQLVDRGEELYGAPLRFIGGESSGAHLACLTAFHLLHSRPAHILDGLVLSYGTLDLSVSMPSAVAATSPPKVLNVWGLRRFVAAVVPGMSLEDRRRPEISPLYADLHALAASAKKGVLPPAIFVCGTDDLLLDDTLLMAAKWVATGSEAVLKAYPGAPHAFTVFQGALKSAEEGNEAILKFVKGKMEDAEDSEFSEGFGGCLPGAGTAPQRVQ